MPQEKISQLEAVALDDNGNPISGELDDNGNLITADTPPVEASKAGTLGALGGIWDWATTPLFGRKETEEDILHPTTENLTQRVLGQSTTPLNLGLEMFGVGSLLGSRVGTARKPIALLNETNPRRFIGGGYNSSPLEVNVPTVDVPPEVGYDVYAATNKARRDPFGKVLPRYNRPGVDYPLSAGDNLPSAPKDISTKPVAVEEATLNSGLDPTKLLPKTKNGLFDYLSLPTGLKASADFGPLFRQGLNYAGRPAWFRAFKSQMQAYVSEGGYERAQAAIADRRLVKSGWAKTAGLHLTDLKGLNNREETIMSELAEKVGQIPIWKDKSIKFVRASNRAYATALNDLRTGVAETYYDDMNRLYQSMIKKAGNNKELIAEAEQLNPNNPEVARRIGEQINRATGRGSLKIGDKFNLEPVASEMNLLMFSPRLLSSRLRTIGRVLDQTRYWKYNPVERKEALKELLSIAGVVGTTIGLSSFLGGESTIDYTNPDMLKAKFGNTRIDPGGGYLQLIVAAGKLLSNSATSSKTGKSYELGSGYGKDSGFDVGVRFARSKLSPIAAFAVDLLDRKDIAGQPLDFTNTNPMENDIAKTLFTPMIAQDLYEILKDDPKLAPALIPGMFGMGLQTYR